MQISRRDIETPHSSTVCVEFFDRRSTVVAVADDHFHVWRVNDSSLLRSLPYHQSVGVILKAPDDYSVILRGKSKDRIEIFDTRTLTSHEIRLAVCVDNLLAISTDGHYIGCESGFNEIVVCSLDDGCEVARLVGHEGNASTLAFVNGVQNVVSASNTMIAMYYWDVLAKTIQWEFNVDWYVSRVIVNNDKWLLTTEEGEYGKIRLRSIDDLGHSQVLHGPDTDVFGACMSPNGKYIVVTDNRNDIFIWETGESRPTYHSAEPDPEGEDRYYDVAFSSDSMAIVGGNFNGTISIWEIG